jgi:hypothetical protein
MRVETQRQRAAFSNLSWEHGLLATQTFATLHGHMSVKTLEITTGLTGGAIVWILNVTEKPKCYKLEPLGGALGRLGKPLRDAV